MSASEAPADRPGETMTVEILGNLLRVRVPPGRKDDVVRAAQLVQQAIERVRVPTDPPVIAIARAALDLAYRSLLQQEQTQVRLEQLLQLLDAEWERIESS